jgi:hypothetical protein
MGKLFISALALGFSSMSLAWPLSTEDGTKCEKVVLDAARKAAKSVFQIEDLGAIDAIRSDKEADKVLRYNFQKIIKYTVDLSEAEDVSGFSIGPNSRADAEVFMSEGNCTLVRIDMMLE